MILRIRGAVHRDIDITERTLVPATADLLQIDGEHYRVSSIQRGLLTDPTLRGLDNIEHLKGWDIVVVVHAASAPSKESWASPGEHPGVSDA